MHLCCDGCGKKVSTPLRPAQWTLTYDGETVSLAPSIGNFSLACGSHYWIRQNRVRRARPMPRSAIRANTARDLEAAEQAFASVNTDMPAGQRRRALWLRFLRRR
ncbi:MAG: DUF6527 family protein [Jatrophihabitans sp.]